MTASEAPWRSLHPGSVAANLLPQTWAAVRSLWPVLLAALWGGTSRVDGTAGLIDLALVTLVFGSALFRTIVHVVTLRYRINAGRLEIQTGLLQRQLRVIAPERVQNVERVRNVFHRLTGLVQVRVETAGGTEVEGLLSALSVEDAELLIRELEAARHRARPTDATTDAADPPPLIRQSFWDLARFGLTQSRMGTSAVVFGVLLELMGRARPDWLAELGGLSAVLAPLALALAVLSGSWLWGVVLAIVRFGDARWLRLPDRLIAEEGLLTRRRVELALSKVQTVRVIEPWLRRRLGGASLSVETAAVREGGEGIGRAEAVIPWVSRGMVPTLLEAALPDLDLDPEAPGALEPPAPAAGGRAVAYSALRTLALCSLVAWWFAPLGLLALLVLPVPPAIAWMDHLAQGFRVTPALLVVRRGLLVRTTWLTHRDKLQAVELQAGPVLRALGLAVMVVRVAGDQVVFPPVRRERAEALMSELLALRAAGV